MCCTCPGPAYSSHPRSRSTATCREEHTTFRPGWVMLSWLSADVIWCVAVVFICFYRGGNSFRPRAPKNLIPYAIHVKLVLSIPLNGSKYVVPSATMKWFMGCVKYEWGQRLVVTWCEVWVFHHHIGRPTYPIYSSTSRQLAMFELPSPSLLATLLYQRVTRLSWVCVNYLDNSLHQERPFSCSLSTFFSCPSPSRHTLW